MGALPSEGVPRAHEMKTDAGVPPTDGRRAYLGTRIQPAPGTPTSYNNQVTACAHFVRSGEHGAERRAGNLETLEGMETQG